MQDVLNEEVETAILGIRSYMETKEVQDRLLNWKDADCPINENFNRLKQLQVYTLKYAHVTLNFLMQQL